MVLDRFLATIVEKLSIMGCVKYIFWCLTESEGKQRCNAQKSGRPVQDHFEKDLDEIIFFQKGSISKSFLDHLWKKDLDQDPI